MALPTMAVNLSRVYEALDEARRNFANVDGEVDPSARTEIDLAMRWFLELKDSGRELSTLSMEDRTELARHLGVLRKNGGYFSTQAQAAFDSLQAVVQGRSLRGTFGRRLETPYRLTVLPRQTMRVPPSNIQDVLAGFDRAGLVPVSPFATSDEADIWAGKSSTYLTDAGLYTGPFDDWLIRLALEEAENPAEAIHSHLDLIRRYCAALLSRRVQSSETSDGPAPLTVLLGPGKWDEQKKRLVGAPEVAGVVVFSNLKPETIEWLTSAFRPFREELGRGGLRLSHPGDWKKRGAELPRSGFIDPVVGMRNVLLIDFNSAKGQELLGAILEQSLRKTGYPRWELGTDALVEFGKIREALEARPSIDFVLIDEKTGGPTARSGGGTGPAGGRGMIISAIVAGFLGGGQIADRGS
ncbi:MAG: hypothetical protein HYU99_06145 [Deltaproteobacteria bacterium]|nr:hypothetical protein [Deltaproteobacteria bacterium]